MLQINVELARLGLPGFLRLVDGKHTYTGATSVVLGKGSLSTMLLPTYKNPLLIAAQRADPTTTEIKVPKQWYKVKIHGVSSERYLRLGLELAKLDIETSSTLHLMRTAFWLKNPQKVRESG
ncbi:hypothetical protein ACJ73_08935 [Blastomyces percursus]|uniref:Uncharacterized protein n=1 Tax=Blastomyces percursus TaxID=1658174 RepID=A0A1J9QL15_9EURO|nr:hypothetical protein ACJ73_08935 [Blastomyces percursus]